MPYGQAWLVADGRNDMLSKSHSRVHDEIRDYEQTLKAEANTCVSANRTEHLRGSASSLTDNMTVTDNKSSVKSIDRSMQLRYTNDRLAKLEQMYVDCTDGNHRIE